MNADIQSANCWIEINKKAIEWNITQLRGNVGKNALFMAVVKSNGYGHGMVEVARVARGAGVDWLGVFSPGEGVALRDGGVDGPVLVLGPTWDGMVPYALSRRLCLTVASMEAAKAVVGAKVPGARVHLKLETGTHRQGMEIEEGVAAKKYLEAAGVIVEGAYTHFADIEDTTEHRFARGQEDRFAEMIGSLNGSGAPISIPHTACSAATILFPSTHQGLVRVGISMYGLWPSKETRVSAGTLGRDALSLQPAMTWKTRIAQVKDLDEQAFVGYGRTYRTTRRSRIAVLPVGYADGYDRMLSNGAYVLVRGRRAPVRGRVCMNLTMVDVTDIEGAIRGDEVVLLGRQGDEGISAEVLAALAQTINYEIVTRAAPGAPRIVVENEPIQVLCGPV